MPLAESELLLGEKATGEDDAETQLYRKAIQIVAESQKASTSYLQRQLRVGERARGAVGEDVHEACREVGVTRARGGPPDRGS